MASKPSPLQGNIFQRFMAAKLLAFPSIIMMVATLVNIAALVIPYWFTVKNVYELNGDYSVKTDHMGIFLYLKDSAHAGTFTDPGLREMLRMQKATNRQIVPATLEIAQIFWILGTTVGGAATVGLILIAVNPYFHLVAEIGLAAAVSISGASLLISVGLAFASLTPENTEALPECEWCTNIWKFNRMSLENPNWGFFVAILGVVMVIVSAVMIWMQFCRTLRAVEYIRSMPYHPLDDEPMYLRYDYRKALPAPTGPMVTLPQMHDTRHGIPGVIHNDPYLASPGKRTPPSSQVFIDDPPMKSPSSYGGSQEVSF